MTARCFLDTNILLYAGSKAKEDAAKRKIATTLIGAEDFGISAQVLQEFVVNALGKARLGYRPAEVDETLKALAAFPIIPISSGLVGSAVAVMRRFQISYWDAAIVAAALELECEVLYSEDLNSGQDYGGVRVINPFR